MYGAAKANEIKQFIRENLNPGGTIYLLGGPLALPTSVSDGLSGFFVCRLQGTSRYDTNLEILREAGVGNEEILICTGTNFADSLSASATGKPILLVGNKLTDAQKAFLATTSGKFVILGGKLAVSETVENELKAYGTVERLSGTSRYDTSVEVAKRFFRAPQSMVLTYGMNFPDGMSGGPLAYNENAPMILAAPYKEAAAQEYAKINGINSGYVLGGSTLIPDESVRLIFGLDGTTNIVVR